MVKEGQSLQCPLCWWQEAREQQCAVHLSIFPRWDKELGSIVWPVDISTLLNEYKPPPMCPETAAHEIHGVSVNAAIDIGNDEEKKRKRYVLFQHIHFLLLTLHYIVHLHDGIVYINETSYHQKVS